MKKIKRSILYSTMEKKMDLLLNNVLPLIKKIRKVYNLGKKVKLLCFAKSRFEKRKLYNLNAGS